MEQVEQTVEHGTNVLKIISNRNKIEFFDNEA